MHVIRLRKPWTRIGSDQATSQIDVPEPPSEAHLSVGGSVLYRRAFNRPTGIDVSTKVHLSIDHWCGEIISITVNDRNFVPQDQRMPMTTDITDWLMPNNRLTIEITARGNTAPRLSGDVALQIETD